MWLLEYGGSLLGHYYAVVRLLECRCAVARVLWVISVAIQFLRLLLCSF